ncbi:hypothetical protein DS2_02575 [Catenovulum agarivorans DS-2]|uniref:Uncharacterized protein n=1 Tax=Catenovulum agarivorans DS-2 TaxID=1328313 RepID=W7QFI8_9ALTE|nr:hypothetical protein [Catenovulum agarivorans]EWH11674.1 hypothetical protein DS2_02575 [Catenovulum agarivorans DS-2]
MEYSSQKRFKVVLTRSHKTSMFCEVLLATHPFSRLNIFTAGGMFIRNSHPYQAHFSQQKQQQQDCQIEVCWDANFLKLQKAWMPFASGHGLANSDFRKLFSQWTLVH